MGVSPDVDGSGELRPRNLRRVEPDERSPSYIRAYVATVSTLGLPIYAVALWLCLRHIGSYTESFWLFAPFLIVTELITIKMSREGEQDEITSSTTFAFALLLTCGIAPAVTVQGLACLLGDAWRRKPWWKAVFNIAQLSLALAAAGAVLERTTSIGNRGLNHLALSELVGIVLSALVLFAVNNGLTGIALAVAQKISIAKSFLDDFWFQISSTGVLLALAPVLVAAANNDPMLVPLFVFPLAAVYQGGGRSC